MTERARWDRIRDHIRATIDVSVRSGFGSEAQLMGQMEDQVRDEFREEDPIAQENEVAAFRAVLEQRIAEQREAEATWSEPTTNDRIDRAFMLLQAEGIVALADAGYTMSDGWEDVHEAAREIDGAWGGAFYHRQDVERAVDGAGLMLAFGAFVRGDEHEPESLRLGRRVCEMLGKYGVPTEWDVTIQSRISIPSFEWKQRRWTVPPR